MTHPVLALVADAVILGRPRQARDRLDRAVAAGVIERAPTRFQLAQGVGRMWHRVVFASYTVGTSTNPVRPSRRARLLANRALRLPVLLAVGAVVPGDLTGLASPPEVLRRHLLTAHHDGRELVYDLELLALHDGELAALRAEAAQVVDGSHPRAPLFRDLCVFTGYHERLVTLLDAILAGEQPLSPSESADPDVSFAAFLRWCLRRPPTLTALLARPA